MVGAMIAIFASCSGNKVDAALDEYEKFMDSYVSLMEKVQEGKLDVMSKEYMNFLSQSADMNTKLKGLEGEMTEAQQKRYLEITMKMATPGMKVMEEEGMDTSSFEDFMHEGEDAEDTEE